MAGRFQKGQKGGPGRPKGMQNKVNADLKEMILGALGDAGGQEYLVKRANDNPTAFMALVGKILPYQVTGDGGGPVRIEATWLHGRSI